MMKFLHSSSHHLVFLLRRRGTSGTDTRSNYNNSSNNCLCKYVPLLMLIAFSIGSECFFIMKMSAPVSLEDNVMLHKRCLYSAVTLLSLLCFGRQTIKGQTTVVSSRAKRLPTQPLTRITPPTRRTLLHP